MGRECGSEPSNPDQVGERIFIEGLTGEPATPAQVLPDSHKMHQLNGFRMSTPPQNRQLIGDSE